MLGATAPMRHHRTVGGDDDDGDGGQGSHLHRPHHHDRRYAADAVDDDDDSYVDDLETSGGPAKSLPRPPPHHLQQQQERLLAPPVRKSRIPSSSSSSSSSSIPRLSIAIPSASSSSRSYTAAATALTRPPSATSMLEEVERAYQRSKASTTSKGSSAASIKSRASAMPQPPSTPSRPLPQTPSYLRAPRRPATPSSYGAPANFATHARRNSGVPRAQALQAVTVKKRVVGGGPKPANPSSSLSSNARAATTPAKASRPSRPANAPVTTIRKPAAAPASTAKPKSATTTATSRAASTAATVPSARATTPSEVDPSKARAALDAIVADIYGTDGGVDAVVSLERTSAAPEPLEAQPSSSSSTSSSSSKYLAPKNPDFRSPSMSAGPSSPSAPYTRPQQPKAGRASSRPSIYSSTRTAASSPSAASKKGKAPEIGIAAKLRLATSPTTSRPKSEFPSPVNSPRRASGRTSRQQQLPTPTTPKTPKTPRTPGGGVGGAKNKLAGAMNKVVSSTATLLGFLISGRAPRKSITAASEASPQAFGFGQKKGSSAAGPSQDPAASSSRRTSRASTASGVPPPDSARASRLPGALRAAAAPFTSKPMSRVVPTQSPSTVSSSRPAAARTTPPTSSPTLSRAKPAETAAAKKQQQQQQSGARSGDAADGAGEQQRGRTPMIRPINKAVAALIPGKLATSKPRAASFSSSRPTSSVGPPPPTTSSATPARPGRPGLNMTATTLRSSSQPAPSSASRTAHRRDSTLSTTSSAAAPALATPPIPAPFPLTVAPPTLSRASTVSTIPQHPLTIDFYGFVTPASPVTFSPLHLPADADPIVARSPVSLAARRLAAVESRAATWWRQLATQRIVPDLVRRALGDGVGAAAFKVVGKPASTVDDDARSTVTEATNADLGGVPVRAMFDPLYAFPHTADKLRTRLAREGVPHLWRGHVWYHLLTHQSRLCDPPDDPHAHAALDAEILTELVDLRGRPSKHQGLIEADVDEAFPNHVLFIEGFGGGAAEGDEAEGEEGGNGETGMGPPRSKGRAQLERLLTAFVQGERRFGYWRGLSKIAAMLVLVMEEERAYIALSHLFHTPPPPSVPSPLPPPHPFYNLRALIASGDADTDAELLFIHEELMRLWTPKLFAKWVQHAAVPSDSYLFAWLSSMFVEAVPPVDLRHANAAEVDEDRAALPFRVLVRVWDLVVLWGCDVLFVVAVALLRKHEAFLLTLPPASVTHFLLPPPPALDPSTPSPPPPLHTRKPAWSPSPSLALLTSSSTSLSPSPSPASQQQNQQQNDLDDAFVRAVVGLWTDVVAYPTKPVGGATSGKKLSGRSVVARLREVFHRGTS